MMLPVLKTTRLTLRPPEEADLDRIVELIGDYEVSKMLAVVPHPYTHQDGRDWLARTAGSVEDGEVVFAIDHGDGLMGCVSVGKLPSRPSLGYWLGRPYWGKGYMSEAACAVLTWVFEKHGIDTVFSQAMDENPASLNVMRKLGFSVEGRGSCESMARGVARPATRTRLEREVFFRHVRPEDQGGKERQEQ
jgi:RimJ/RimL family protein N-acetyltransferase